MWAAPLLDFTYEPVPSGPRLARRLRSRRDDFSEVVPALTHRVDPGIDADPQRTAGQLVDAASFTSRLTLACARHEAERNRVASRVMSRHKTNQITEAITASQSGGRSRI